MEKTRNYGIDLLRILAMFFVVTYHVVGHGGIKDAAELAGRGQFAMVWLVEVLVYGGVNTFALISGYVGYRDDDFRVRFSNVIVLWLQVFFYGTLLLVLWWVISPDSFSFTGIAGAVMPVAFGEYWYFSAYFGVFLLSGLLNKFVYYSKDDFKYVLGIIILFFSSYSTIAGRFSDPFCLNNGFSFLWLIALYLLGAWIKKSNLAYKIKSKYIWYILVICLLVPWMFKVFISFILAPMLGDSIMAIGNFFIYYLSPTVLFFSVCLVLLFAKIKVTKLARGFIKVFSPIAFGVYIIHEDLFIKSFFIMDKFRFVAELDVWYIPLVIFGISILIFIICGIIDWIRIYIFKLLKIRKFAEKVEYYGRTICYSIYEKIETRMP